MTKEQQAEAEREFGAVINRLGLEKFSNTPDFIIAKHLVWSLLDFNATSQAREAWYGVSHEPGKRCGEGPG